MKNVDRERDEQYMQDMFPCIPGDVIAGILASNKYDLELSMDEALSLMAIEEEHQRDAQRQAGRRISRADIPTVRDRDCGAVSTRAQKRGPSLNLPGQFLAIPKTRIVLDEIFRHFIDFTCYVCKSDSAKIGVTLCRAEGGVALYSVSPALLKLRDDSSAIETIRPGDILRGINQEFFNGDTSIDDISLVLSNAGRIISLHLRRIDSASPHMSIVSAQEHIMVKLILQAYKSSPSNFTAGFSESIALILKRILTWDRGYVIQNIPNKLLHTAEPLLISPIYASDTGFGRREPEDPRAVLLGTSTAFKPILIGGHSSDSFKSLGGRKNVDSAFAIVDVQLAVLKENWRRRVKIDITSLRPALSVRIVKVVKHRNNGFVEYVLSISDVFTGYEWRLSKGYTDFNDLKKVCLLTCVT